MRITTIQESELPEQYSLYCCGVGAKSLLPEPNYVMIWAYYCPALSCYIIQATYQKSNKHYMDAYFPEITLGKLIDTYRCGWDSNKTIVIHDVDAKFIYTLNRILQLLHYDYVRAIRSDGVEI